MSPLGPTQQTLLVCVCSRTTRDIIHGKTGVCSSLRAKFYSVAQEAAFCLQDKMEVLLK